MQSQQQSKMSNKAAIEDKSELFIDKRRQ